jgi:hypothetical protein
MDDSIFTILSSMPNFIGFGLMSIVLYRQNNRLIDLLGDELRFWRERASALYTANNPTPPPANASP